MSENNFDMKKYLELSERTEKKFPEGMELSHNQRYILSQLTQDFLMIGEGLDHMKRHLIYGAECSIEAPETETKLRIRTLDSDEAEMLHAALGIATEAVEFFDAVMKVVLNGGDMDGTNLFEEIGDQLWYQAMALRLLNMTFEDSAQTNIDKLAARYPDKFTSEAALNRNLIAERGVLEGGLKKGELNVIAAGVNVGKSQLGNNA